MSRNGIRGAELVIDEVNENKHEGIQTGETLGLGTVCGQRAREVMTASRGAQQDGAGCSPGLETKVIKQKQKHNEEPYSPDIQPTKSVCRAISIESAIAVVAKPDPDAF